MVEQLRTGDIIRKVDGSFCMVIKTEGMTPIVIYHHGYNAYDGYSFRYGFDWLEDLITDKDIQAVARPTKEYMFSIDNWNHYNLWSNPDNIIYTNNKE